MIRIEIDPKNCEEAVHQLVHAIKATASIMTMDQPGTSHLMYCGIINELEKLLPEPTEGCSEECCANCDCDECSWEHWEDCFDGGRCMTFGEALEALKAGKRVAREGWNGKEQYIQMAAGISYVTPHGTICNVEHRNIGNRCLAFHGTSGVQMGWLASQADMLAEDWYIV